MRPGLLVTGLPRSGTSWVGKMLHASGDVVYINEPMNPSRPPGRSPGVLDAEVRHYFEYVCRDNDERWARAFADTLALRYRLLPELRANRRPYDLAKAGRNLASFGAGRLRGHRALLDDPYALFAVPWLAEQFGVRAVILIREPVALIASWLQHGWIVNSRELLDQPLLMRDHLEPHRCELEAVTDSTDGVAATAALWNAAYDAVERQLSDTAGVWVTRYEDLARDPVATFRQLFERLDLSWSDEVERRIVGATGGRESGGGRAFKWSFRGGPAKTAYRPMDSAASLDSYRERLSEAQAERAATLTTRVRSKFYPA